MTIVGCLSMLQRKRYAVLSAVLLGGCTHEAPPDGVNQQIAALRAQVAALTLEVRQPNRPPPDEEGRRQALKAQEQANQSRFDAQPADPELTRQAQTVFEPLFGAWAKGGGRVECHRTLCRSESVHEGPTSYRQFIQSAFQGTKAAWLGAYTIARAEPTGGGYTVVTFFGPEPAEAKRIREIFGRATVASAPAGSTSATPTSPSAPASSSAPATRSK